MKRSGDDRLRYPHQHNPLGPQLNVNVIKTSQLLLSFQLVEDFNKFDTVAYRIIIAYMHLLFQEFV